MTRKQIGILAGVAAVLLGAGVALNVNRAHEQSLSGGGRVFTDFTPALAEIGEIRLSKGDGSRTTLRKQANGWTVVERQYPADPQRVRELLLGLNNLKIVERKTSDPANYAKLGVETPDKPTAASTLVEVVAGKKTWSLIVGKNAEGRALYARKPSEAASTLVEPAITVDPDQKRWIDRQLTDIPGANVHDISVKPAAGPAYLLTRTHKGDPDLVLGSVPKGRKPASNMAINGQADTLSAFVIEDVRNVPGTEPPPASTDYARIRLFDGQVFEFYGRKEADKAFVHVSASRDAALAAQFPDAKPAPAAPAAPVTPAAPAPAGAPTTPASAAAAPAPAAAPAAKPVPADQTVERLAARSAGVEYEIPVYKYESLFKPQEELLEPKPAPAAPAAAKPKKLPHSPAPAPAS